MPITSSAVQVELNISVWTANKLDRNVTDTVLNSNGASKGSGKFTKNLMAGTHHRKEIADFAAACRMWHNTQTLPWADRGPRILPMSLFLDYKQEANTRKQEFEAMVDNFMSQYEHLKQVARASLGTLDNEDDYPSAEEVRSKFGFRLVISPIPESKDFRLDIPQQDLEEAMENYEQDFNTRIADAMREPWNKLHKMLTGMSERLTEINGPAQEKKRWHEAFITNAQNLCSMLTHLNITGDPDLETARKQLELTMLGADIDDIKYNPQARETMKTKVDSILEQFNW